MPINAYSQVLWELPPGYSIPGPQLSDPVPIGFVWVVRQVSARYFSNVGSGHGILSITLEAGSLPIWATPYNGTVDGELYEAQDVRFVMEEQTQLSINTDQPDWSLRVSGYQLTLAPGLTR